MAWFSHPIQVRMRKEAELPVKVLLVEDQRTFAELLKAILSQVLSNRMEVTLAHRLSEAAACLKEGQWDVVLLDLSLPDQQGLRTYEEVKRRAGAAPIIVLSGLDDEDVAVEAVRQGAQDYLVKGQFDSRMLGRAIRYAIERKRIEERLGQSEEFHRLISENVSDLIAVLDPEGRRLYNSPSYNGLLGAPDKLRGTTSFLEIHPEDRERIGRIFRETIESGIGQRTDYRFLIGDGTVRHVESQGSVIRDKTGAPCKVVVVSRDITNRILSERELRAALAEVQTANEQLKATQRQLLQSEKLEIVSTFAAGVAHEVKNPLQTILLGIDYLSQYVTTDDPNATLLLEEMSLAVERCDSVIRGLLELSVHSRRDIREHDLSRLIAQSLRGFEEELGNHSVRLVLELAPGLPLLRLDGCTMKHVFINLFGHCIRAMAAGGTLTVRTYAHGAAQGEDGAAHGAPSGNREGTIVVAEIEELAEPDLSHKSPGAPRHGSRGLPNGKGKEKDFGLMVSRKIIELYGGKIETNKSELGTKYTLSFKT